jgi:hypothetical protein
MKKNKDGGKGSLCDQEKETVRISGIRTSDIQLVVQNIKQNL